MKRYLYHALTEDLDKKIVLLTGPRQSGKTTLARMMSDNFDYFNFDNPEHRTDLLDRSWDRKKDLVIFDELHKLKNWKSWLKGIYDTEGIPPAILVTGSAKLDTYKKVGDSLAGRFFQYRLHPLDLKEISLYHPSADRKSTLEKLLAYSSEIGRSFQRKPATRSIDSGHPCRSVATQSFFSTLPVSTLSSLSFFSAWCLL